MMTDMFSPLVADRMTALNADPVRSGGRYVLVWLQQTLRLHDQQCLVAAADIAKASGKPVLVYHGLGEGYPHASARIHRFIVGASATLAKACLNAGIRSVHHIARPGNRDNKLVYRLIADACAVITDEHFTFVPHTQALSVASKIDVAMWRCDATRLVPTRVLPAGIKSTRDFRAAHTPLRSEYLGKRPTTPDIEPYTGAISFEDDNLAAMGEAALDALVGTCDIDHSVRPHPDFPATEHAVSERLRMLPKVVGEYRLDRNNPAIATSTTRLSPYLRFGIVSPWQIIEAIGTVPASARWKFLDELLTWREWAHYRASAEPHLKHYDTLGPRLHALLDAGRGDERLLVPLVDLAAGRSPDPVWNAAQIQWLMTGWMHNNLRMYWASQLLAWTASPEEAWALGCYLNDRLSLDGRDPATYASMRFAFGEAKPSFRTTPVYGRIYRKSSRALLARSGFAEWVALMNASQRDDLDMSGFAAAADLYRKPPVSAQSRR